MKQLRPRVLAIVFASLMLASCASTAARNQTAIVSDGTRQRTGSSSSDSTEEDTATSTDATLGSGGTTLTGATASTAARRSTATTGVTTKGTVKIGFGYPSNLSAVFAAFGGNNLTGDDWKSYIGPIVTWVNAHGGLGGRAVVPVYHSNDPTSGTFQSQAEQACTAFTQDDKVFAVIGTVLADNEVDCLAKANTPFVAQSPGLFDRTMFATHPGLVFQPFGISAERLGVWVDSLASQGYFAKNAKVGILEMDNAVYHRFSDSVLKPRLAAHGVKVTDEIAFTVPDSAGSVGTLYTQAANAVLRFKSQGITHVILSPAGGAIPFVFMPAAKTQGYHPRYALNSLEVPAFVTQNVPAEQLTGSIGIGWLPASDVFYKEVAHGQNPAEDLCYAITKRNGDEVKRYCDGLFFLKAALDRSPVFTPAALRASVEALGTSYNSPWTFNTRFGPGRYDGARQVRALAFVDACTCYRYNGPLIDAP